MGEELVSWSISSFGCISRTIYWLYLVRVETHYFHPNDQACLSQRRIPVPISLSGLRPKNLKIIALIQERILIHLFSFFPENFSVAVGPVHKDHNFIIEWGIGPRISFWKRNYGVKKQFLALILIRVTRLCLKPRSSRIWTDLAVERKLCLCNHR